MSNLANIFVISCIVAFYARRRGYSFLLWFFFAFLGDWLLTAIVLAYLPDRSVERHRGGEMRRIQRQLATAGLPSSVNPTPLPRATISDHATVLDSAQKAVASKPAAVAQPMPPAAAAGAVPSVPRAAPIDIEVSPTGDDIHPLV